MTNCQHVLNEIFKKAIAAAFPDLVQAPVAIHPSQGDRFGDYQCNSAMAINQVSWYQIIGLFSQLSNLLVKISL